MVVNETQLRTIDAIRLYMRQLNATRSLRQMNVGKLGIADFAPAESEAAEASRGQALVLSGTRHARSGKRPAFIPSALPHSAPEHRRPAVHASRSCADDVRRRTPNSTKRRMGPPTAHFDLFDRHAF